MNVQRQTKGLGAIAAIGLAAGLTTVGADRPPEAGLRDTAAGVPGERRLFSIAELGVDAVTADGALGLTIRTHGGPDFGRANASGAGFPLRLTAGDFNADGRDDLVIGAPYDSGAIDGGGWFGVAHGGARFPGPMFASSGTERHGNWGDVLMVGDYDADRFDDLVIGAPERNFAGPQSGALFLFSGSATGVGGQSRPFGPTLGEGARLGAALATGDFNGDGIDDLAVSGPNVTVDGQSEAGRVIVLPGQAGAGPVTGGALTIDRTLETVPGEPAARERFGTALVAGDFDGDGYTDLAIGNPERTLPGLPGAGSVTVVYCAPDPESGAPEVGRAVEITRDQTDVPGEAARTAAFGVALVAANLDGDPYDDLVVGSPGAPVDGRVGAGDLVVLQGGALSFDPERTLVVDQNTPLVPGTSEARSGFGSVLATGDLNGDGHPDLIVGTPAERVASLPEVGSVTALYADESGLNTRVALRLAPGMAPLGFPAANRQGFGSGLAVADLNGDGVSDLAVGVPGLTVGDVEEAGALVVAWGYDPELPGVSTTTPSAHTPTPRPTITPTPRPTKTSSPPGHIYVPYATRLRSLDRFPTPVLPDL